MLSNSINGMPNLVFVLSIQKHLFLFERRRRRLMSLVMDKLGVNFWKFVLIISVLFVGLSDAAWINARATFYGGNQNPSTLGGACGYENVYQAGFGEHTAALSGALFRGGEACGACYQVICNTVAERKWCLRRGSVTVTATNFCPSNNQGGWCDPPRHHFDMSTPAFFRIARQGNEGVVPVLYRRVACRRRGGVRFTLKGHSYFNIIMISNVGGGGDIKSAWIQGSRSRTWSPMTRNWGANWQSNYDFRFQTLSFRITLVNGRTLTFLNVAPSSWNFGQTFSSRNQFS